MSTRTSATDVAVGSDAGTEGLPSSAVLINRFKVVQRLPDRFSVSLPFCLGILEETCPNHRTLPAVRPLTESHSRDPGGLSYYRRTV